MILTSFRVHRWWVASSGKIALAVLSILGFIEVLLNSTVLLTFEFGQIGRLVAALVFGSFVGRRIGEARYFWPLIIVATVSDLGSVMLSGGFSHGLAQKVMQTPSLIHPLLVYVPTPFGSPMPLIGLADVIFIALCISVVVKLGLSTHRVLTGLTIGMCLGLSILVCSLQPVPMLPFLGLSVGICLGTEIKPKGSELLQAMVLLLILGLSWLFLR